MPKERGRHKKPYPDGSMKARIGWILLGLFVVTVALSSYVMISAALDIAAARRALTGGPMRLEQAELDSARRHLEHAQQIFESLPARAVGWMPVVRQNFGALHSVAEKGLPVAEAASALREAMDEVGESSLIKNGAVELGLLEDLEEPLRAQSSALSSLVDEVRVRRNGWLVPLLWSQMDRLLDQAEELRSSAETAAELVALAPSMLGGSGERTYLVALMNNTELRGAGGILSGVGSVKVSDGRITLGDFQHYQELADEPPYRRVSAPKDFRENFGTYKADTTRWVTTTSSPDVPDVASVASELFKRTTGIDVDGVILVDPRGLAAMLPANTRIEVPTTKTVLTAEELPGYVYRGAYEELGGAVSRRRDSLIRIGQDVFESVSESGFGRPSLLRSTGQAAAGGHLSLVSFVPEEADVLERIGVTRDLGNPTYDQVLATVQNVGGNKLDYYSHRSIHHECRIEEQEPATCSTDVTIENATPSGLSRFEYQYLPYGLFKNVLEIYVPAEAELLAVEVGGSPEDFFKNREDGLAAVGVYLEIPRGQKKTVSVEYQLAAKDHYALTVVPQPLVDDARLTVELDMPGGWELDGPEGAPGDTVVRWEGFLDRRLEFEMGPSEKSGLASWWTGFRHFLDEPIL